MILNFLLKMVKPKQEQKQETLVRILSTDIRAKMSLLYGFSKIKGVSYTFANALCHVLKLDKKEKIGNLTEEKIEKIEEYLSSQKKEGIPKWMFNNQKDHSSGKNLHITGKELDFAKIQQQRRLAKTRSYKALRTKLKLPVRGQRTQSNFRRSKTLAAIKAKQQGGKK